MELPNIYDYLNPKYDPFVKYLFILPSSDFLSFLKSVQVKKGIAREFHGYDIESDFIEFWDASNNKERTVEITYLDFLNLIEPLKLKYLSEFPEKQIKIDNLFKIERKR
jgi:hypothetical protein